MQAPDPSNGPGYLFCKIFTINLPKHLTRISFSSYLCFNQSLITIFYIMGTKTNKAQSLSYKVDKEDTRGTVRIKGYFVSTSIEDPDPAVYKISHPLFKAVEKFFWDWLEGQKGQDVYEMYTGSFEEMGGQSYLDPKGAVEEGINFLFQYMVEENRTLISSKEWYGMDMEVAFYAP